MDDRTCGVCGKIFPSPSKLKRHQARATPCDGVLEKSFPCRYCAQCFTDRGNRSRHELHRCSKNPTRQSPIDVTTLTDPVGLSTDLVKMLEIHKAELREIKDLIHSQKGTTTTKTNTADRIGDNRIANTLIQGDASGTKIVINNFGEEDFSGMLQEVGSMLDALPEGTPGRSVISSTLGLMYNNPKRPQNRSVRITNQRSNVPQIREGGVWVKTSEAGVYPTMIKAACQFLEKNQDWCLGDRLETRPILAFRSAHVRAAFDVEKALMSDEKEQIKIIRGHLYT